MPSSRKSASLQVDVKADGLSAAVIRIRLMGKDSLLDGFLADLCLFFSL
jgi:hypothetical protein